MATNKSKYSTVTLLFKKIRIFTKMSAGEMRLFLECWVTMGVMRTAILILSFKRLTRSMKQLQRDEDSIPVSDSDMTTATTIGQMIVRAANNTPWESACLVQALTAYNMLRRRNIPGVFFLGVHKEKSMNKNLTAHAWSQCGHSILTGFQGHENYKVLSKFSWDCEKNQKNDCGRT